MRLLILIAAAVLSPAAALAQNCPGGRCPTQARYVHPVYVQDHLRGATKMIAASPEPGYTPGAPMPEPTPAIAGSGPGAKCWVFLKAQDCWGWGYKLPSGLWRIDPGTKRRPEPPRDSPTATAAGPDARSAVGAGGSLGGAPGTRAAGQVSRSIAAKPENRGNRLGTPVHASSAADTPGTPSNQAAPADHRGRFVQWLCSYRAQHGLGPVGYSEDLEWAALHNCRLQAQARVSGHYAPNGGWWQVAFHGPTSLDQAIQGWVASAAHNAALLEPSVSMIGLAVEGVSWTCNLR